MRPARSTTVFVALVIGWSALLAACSNSMQDTETCDAIMPALNRAIDEHNQANAEGDTAGAVQVLVGIHDILEHASFTEGNLESTLKQARDASLPTNMSGFTTFNDAVDSLSQQCQTLTSPSNN